MMVQIQCCGAACYECCLCVWQSIKGGLGLLNAAFEMPEEESEKKAKKKPLTPRKFRKLESELKVGGIRFVDSILSSRVACV